MPPTRTLRLAREALTELAGDDLLHIAGGATVRDLCGETLGRVCDATREPGTCHWTVSLDPWVCLTLSPCP